MVDTGPPHTRHQHFTDKLCNQTAGSDCLAFSSLCLSVQGLKLAITVAGPSADALKAHHDAVATLSPGVLMTTVLSTDAARPARKGPAARTARHPWTWQIAAALLVAAATAQAASGSLVINRLGFTDDAHPSLHGPALYLKGDGPPDNDSFDAFASQVSDDAVDVVVLGASFPHYEGECLKLNQLDRVNSCTTVVIRDPEDASDPQVVAALQRAEIVYFRGGDQCNFMRWKGSQVIAQVQALVQRGGGSGGGSAGLAIQGGLAVFDGCSGSISSRLALAEPHQPSVSFSPGLFNWAPLTNVLTDSHFVKRDRMGRMMAFLCRQLAEGNRPKVWGLGLTDGGALLIDRDGVGTVFGADAYLVQAQQGGGDCADVASPVNHAGYKIWRYGVGEVLDLTDRPQSGYYEIDVAQGQLSGDPYSAPAQSENHAQAVPSADRPDGR
jgi:cyanophycinase-like exopeptidase